MSQELALVKVKTTTLQAPVCSFINNKVQFAINSCILREVQSKLHYGLYYDEI